MTIAPHVRQALIEARGQVWAQHRDDPNFTGCGIGYRRRAGVMTDEPVVVAMVVDKLPAGALSARRLLPASVSVNGADYGVDVVEAGPFRAAAEQTAPRSVTNTGPLTGPYRPLVMGCGISNPDVAYSNPGGPTESPSPTGTLGCFVRTDNPFDLFLVSAGHVIGGGANMWTQGTGGNIIQPGAADQGSTGSTYSTPVASVYFVNTLDTTSGSLANQLDYGMASVSSSVLTSAEFAGNLMPPISATHLAVGMVIASDPEGNCFLTRMDTLLSEIGGMLAGANETGAGTTPPQVGMNIEKVGRSSGYTSSTVDATDVIATVRYIHVDINTPQVFPITMSGLIWSQYFSISGDSGAVACQGGDGHTYVLPPAAPCALLQNVQSYYALPGNTADNTLTNRVQAKVLSQTLCGNLLIGLVYMNQQTIIDRLTSSTGPDHNQAAAQAFFQQFYATYRPIAVSMLTNPGSFTVTSQMATDFTYALNMLSKAPADGGQGLLTPQETYIFTLALYLVDEYSGGASYQQIQAGLDSPGFYDIFYAAIASAPTIVAP